MSAVAAGYVRVKYLRDWNGNRANATAEIGEGVAKALEARGIVRIERDKKAQATATKGG